MYWLVEILYHFFVSLIKLDFVLSLYIWGSYFRVPCRNLMSDWFDFLTWSKMAWMYCIYHDGIFYELPYNRTLGILWMESSATRCWRCVNEGKSGNVIAASTLNKFAINSISPRQDGCHFADDCFKCSFLNEMYEFRLKCHAGLLGVQLTIFQHWFRKWLFAVQATSHYQNQWSLVNWRICTPFGLNFITATSCGRHGVSIHRQLDYLLVQKI